MCDPPTWFAITELEVGSFRCFDRCSLSPSPEGLTLLVGANGSGKSSLLEAVTYSSTGRSFRGSSRDVLVKAGCTSAFVRARAVGDRREVLVESEISRFGRGRTQVNRQPLRSPSTLAAVLPTTMFSPGDLAIVQGPPATRRGLLDDAAIAMDPPFAAVVEEYERCVRQRNALLREAAWQRRARGRSQPDRGVEISLGVWDERLARVGEVVRSTRCAVVASLEPIVAATYADLALTARDRGVNVALRYRSSSDEGLLVALEKSREDDWVRGTTSVGPHHDDLDVLLEGRDARHQASQGEQRCLAVSLRLGVHRLVTAQRGAAPVLLLDDVLSELDPNRAGALLSALPPGQTLVTATASRPEMPVARLVCMRDLGAR